MSCLSGKRKRHMRNRQPFSRRFHALMLLLLLAVIFAGMFLLLQHTPLQMDDFEYSFSWKTGERISGIADIFASQTVHYRLWGGRFVTHFLAQFFLYAGKPVFNAAGAAAFLLLLLELSYLAGGKGGIAFLPVCIFFLLLFFCIPFFGTVFLWLDGACNYLFGTLLALLPLVIARNRSEGGFFSGGLLPGLLSVLLSFLGGFTNENTACGVLAALLLFLLLRWRNGKAPDAATVLSLLAETAGVLCLLLAPGNFARAGQGGFSLTGILKNGIYVVYCFLLYCGIPLALTVLALCIRGIPEKESSAGILMAAAVLSGMALMLSPEVSDRTFLAPFVLLSAAFVSLAGPALEGIRNRAALAFPLVCLVVLLCGRQALLTVTQQEARIAAQEEAILTAKAGGEEEVRLSGIPASSRFTRDIFLAEDPAQWPNSTLQKYYGIRIIGE